MTGTVRNMSGVNVTAVHLLVVSEIIFLECRIYLSHITWFGGLKTFFINFLQELHVIHTVVSTYHALFGILPGFVTSNVFCK